MASSEDEFCLTLETEVVALYEEHAAGLRRYAGTLTHCPDRARDAVQEVFLRYFAERRCGRTIEHPRAWLYQVARNYTLDRLTSAAARREVTEDSLAGMQCPEENPEGLMQRSEMARQIAASLSVRERECLGLRSEGFSYNEIADVMGLASGTVGALLTRAHTKIRAAAKNSQAKDGHVAGAIQKLFENEKWCTTG